MPLTLSNPSNVNMTAYALEESNGTFSMHAMNRTYGSGATNVTLVVSGVPFYQAQVMYLKQTDGDVTATSGITLGGQPIDGDGTWTGDYTTNITASGGVFTVSVPAAQVAIIHFYDATGYDAADAYVQDGSANQNTNFGGSDALDVKTGSVGYNRITYMKFSVADFSGSISSATVTLVPTDVGETGITNAAYAVSDTSWSESGIVYNNAPAIGTQIASWTVPAVGMPVTFDVTAQAQAAQAATACSPSPSRHPLGRLATHSCPMVLEKARPRATSRCLPLQINRQICKKNDWTVFRIKRLF